MRPLCLLFIFALTACSVVQAADDVQMQLAADLAAPVHVMVDGEPLEVGGFAAPWVGDFDGDGRRDLLVGQRELGRMRIYRNVGSNRVPKFQSFEWFQAAGEPACVRPCCQVSFAPQLVDFDGDGDTDVLTGSGIGGESYVFRRLADGSFGEAEVLRDAFGELLMLRWSASGRPARGRPYNVTAFSYDWDKDGDHDILLGYSPMCLVMNEGTDEDPQFDGGRILQCNGEPLKTGFGRPQMADWDGDGRDDLIAGAGRDIVWYRNAGRPDAPRLEPARLLVPQQKPVSISAVPTETPGFHHAFCVADFNDDGCLDLLVGDQFLRVMPVSDLMREQELLNAEHLEILKQRYDELARDARAAGGGDGDFQHYAELLRVWQQYAKFQTARTYDRDTFSRYGGFVWYYQRK